MKWQPISEADILEEVNKSHDRMSREQKRLWEVMKIDPEKWQEETYGKEGGGFWAVAIIGNNVIWYNDIEDGFNRSKFDKYGEIRDYWCNQDQLEWAIQNIINELNDGCDSRRYASPPQPGCPKMHNET